MFGNQSLHRGGETLNNMKLFTLAIIALLVGAAGTAVVTHYMPQEATVTSIELAFKIDDTPWLNGTPIDWGNVVAGQSYNKTLWVNNTGTIANVNVSFILVSLPMAWLETWTGNNTVLNIGETVTGNITLTIPLSATDGTYTWNSYIIGTET